MYAEDARLKEEKCKMCSKNVCGSKVRYSQSKDCGVKYFIQDKSKARSV